MVFDCLQEGGRGKNRDAGIYLDLRLTRLKLQMELHQPSTSSNVSACSAITRSPKSVFPPCFTCTEFFSCIAAWVVLNLGHNNKDKS